ncbi:MAG: AAA family ATPase [Crocinitomicaceae bacterium]|nr:AAA family ATPase [Crocinitomicaceae bacterium]
MNNQLIFPFSAIVGQEAFKTALILSMIDPTIGGVLAVGDKGTGKTTLIRSMAAVLSKEKEVPFVNLPIGASEDRVLGSIQLGTLINEKKEVVQKGLLAKAHNGMLYVDEINLLNDYLMDSLLDASATGSYYLEREGISQKMDSRFCLIGSMNPEEGDLRPQLKDRFGLSVNINTPTDVSERSLIVKHRMKFDANPDVFVKEFEQQEQMFYNKLEQAKAYLNSIKVSNEVICYATELAISYGVEGVRADILLIKTASAFAAWNNKLKVTIDHVNEIADFVLNHRKKQEPENQESQDQNQQEEDTKGSEGKSTDDNFVESKRPDNNWKPLIIEGKNRKGVTGDGRLQQTEISQEKQIDARKTIGQYMAKDRFELIPKHEENKSIIHVIFLLDASGSMRKEGVVSFAKGFIERVVMENEGKRMQFSLAAIHDNQAKIYEEKVSNAGVLIERMEEIPTGGKTNAIAAMKLLKGITINEKKASNQLIFLTDGRFGESTNEEIQQAVSAFQIYGKAVTETLMIDTERGAVTLGLVKQFADKIGAQYEQIQIPLTR